MDEIIVLGIFLALCYLAIGLGVGMMLDTSVYNIDISIGCMLFWPIIILIVAIFELCKFVKVLFKKLARPKQNN